MNQYEALYIIVPEIDEEATKAEIEKFKGIVEANNGEDITVDEWGKRRLAYAINYKTEGYYVLVCFQCAADLPREIERNLQISESVIRYQVVRVLDKRSVVKPRAPRPVFAPKAETIAEPVQEETASEEAAQEPVIE